MIDKYQSDISSKSLVEILSVVAEIVDTRTKKQLIEELRAISNDRLSWKFLTEFTKGELIAEVIHYRVLRFLTGKYSWYDYPPDDET